MNILQALDDPKVFGGFFRGPTWSVWRAFLAALFGLPLSGDQLETYRKHTGRSTPPANPSHEAWLCIGRRGGKSFVLSVIAVFLAAFKDWRPFLGPGEVGTIMIIAADRRQARVIMRYCLGLLKSVPMLAQLIEAETRESVSLRNRVVIEVHTASFRSTRGYSIVCALLDEIATGRPTNPAPSPTSRSSTRSSRARRPSPAPCCCAPRRPTRARARCGPRSRGTSAGTAIRSWSGGRARAR
jgi:hypothetical protein